MKTVSLKKLISLGLINPNDEKTMAILSSSSKEKYLSKYPTSNITEAGYYFYDGTTLYKFQVPSNCEIKIYARKKR